MEYSASGVAVVPGETFSFTLSAENTGPVGLSDVAARVQLPGRIGSFSENLSEGLNCFGSINPSVCVANGGAMWTVGALAPGERRTITFSPTIRSDARRGTVLRSLVRGTARGSDEVVLQRDVLIADEDTPLPVELTTFEAAATGTRVVLGWATASETNNAGFDVERSTDGVTFAPLGFVSGHGTTAEPRAYRFVDAQPPFATTVHYRLRQVDIDGAFEDSPVATVTLRPTRMTLLPGAPNPFRMATRLRYELPEAAAVHLQVYDLLGRRVTTLVDGEQPAGRHEATLDGARLAPGTYFVHLRAGDTVLTQMVQLVR
jgi:hypothetical protein